MSSESFDISFSLDAQRKSQDDREEGLCHSDTTGLRTGIVSRDQSWISVLSPRWNCVLTGIFTFASCRVLKKNLEMYYKVQTGSAISRRISHIIIGVSSGWYGKNADPTGIDSTSRKEMIRPLSERDASKTRFGCQLGTSGLERSWKRNRLDWRNASSVNRELQKTTVACS